MWNSSAADRFAEFVLALVVPWDLHTGRSAVKMTGAGFCEWAYRVYTRGSFLERSRYRYLEQITGLGRVPNRTKVMQVGWRARHCTVWGERDGIPDTTNPDSLVLLRARDDRSTKQVDRVEDLIDIIRA